MDLKVAHNIISDCIMTDNGCGIFLRDTRDNLFKGMVICRSQENGIFMAQAAVKNAEGLWLLTPNTECTGNIFSDLLVVDSAGAGFRANNESCVNNMILGARFARNGNGGLWECKRGLVKVEAILKQ